VSCEVQHSPYITITIAIAIAITSIIIIRFYSFVETLPDEKVWDGSLQRSSTD
jgi:hypothetical protein